MGGGTETFSLRGSAMDGGAEDKKIVLKLIDDKINKYSRNLPVIVYTELHFYMPSSHEKNIILCVLKELKKEIEKYAIELHKVEIKGDDIGIAY